MPWESVIGLEVHAQLKTKTKIFCGCPTDFGMEPNEQICPVCIGMPGVLPVLNREAVELAIRTGLALNCEIAADCRFDRKNYFYADLPKGYQISQFELPICKEGHLDITGKTVRIQRAHLEEDAGKLVHAGADGLHGSEYSLADYNRSSMPLLEIVSQPDIETRSRLASISPISAIYSATSRLAMATSKKAVLDAMPMSRSVPKARPSWARAPKSKT